MDLEARACRMVASNLASLRGDDLGVAVQFVEQMLAQIEASSDLTEAAECCLNLAVGSYWLAKIRRSLSGQQRPPLPSVTGWRELLILPKTPREYRTFLPYLVASSTI